MGAPRNENYFEPDASVVLIGCRGAGKRTLGFVGALHLRWRLVTEDQYFQMTTGATRGEYLSEHGRDAFARRSIEVFKHMLDNNRSECIITCAMTSLTEDAQAALRAFSKANPVVYVHREREHVGRLLGWSEAEALLEADESHRTCSNLEFFNAYAPHQETPPGLLSVRQDFAWFLDHVTGRAGTRAWLDSPFSLAAIPPEYRAFSYAMRLRLSYLVKRNLGWDAFEARGDCVELIIDTWPENILAVVAEQFALIRRSMGVPIIYHVEENPRGERRRLQDERDAMDTELLDLGLRLGADYLSLDLERDAALVDHVLKRRGRSKVIGNFVYTGFNALSWTDDRQLENFRRAQMLGCDIVRMARFCMADSSVKRLLQLKEKLEETIPDPKPPLVAYDFSVLGLRIPFQSRVLGPVRHRLIENERDHLATVADHMSAFRRLFNSSVLEPLQFYVAGADAASSLLPATHRAAYEFCGMPHACAPYTCAAAEELVHLCTGDSFGGASLAAPFRTSMIPHLKAVSRDAAVIGAVNLALPLRGKTGLVLDHANSRNRAGRTEDFYGDNTDWRSIHTCLRRAISPRNHVQPSKTTGLVVGAGVTARAAIYALLQLGCRSVFIYNRTVANAEAVAAHFNDWAAAAAAAAAPQSRPEDAVDANGLPRYRRRHHHQHEVCHVLASATQAWPQSYQAPTMVVSCVPATATDGSPPAGFEMPLHWLQSPTGGVVVELAQGPLVTPLVAQMQAFRNGPSPPWTVVDGPELAAEMAAETFELMTGRLAPKRLMAEILRRAWEEQQQQ